MPGSYRESVWVVCLLWRWCEGGEGVLGIFWHTRGWESRIALMALKGRHCFISSLAVVGWEGTFWAKGTVLYSAAVIEKLFFVGCFFFFLRGRHNSGGHICSCLYACSTSFTPLWILPCGFLGFSLSWGVTDYCKEAAWDRFFRSQISRIRLAFSVSTMEWEAVNPAQCEWLYIGIT